MTKPPDGFPAGLDAISMRRMRLELERIIERFDDPEISDREWDRFVHLLRRLGANLEACAAAETARDVESSRARYGTMLRTIDKAHAEAQRLALRYPTWWATVGVIERVARDLSAPLTSINTPEKGV